jgi:hypothetical protein
MTTHCVKVRYLQNVEFSRVFLLQHSRERDHFFGSNCLRSNPTTSHNRGEGLLHKIIMSYMNLQTSKACKCVYKSVCMCVCVCVCFLLPTAAAAAASSSSSLLDSKTTTTLLFSSLLLISRDFYYGYSSHGMLLLLLHCYIQRQQQNIFSSLLFSSFQGISIMGILPMVPIHKIKYKED